MNVNDKLNSTNHNYYNEVLKHNFGGDFGLKTAIFYNALKHHMNLNKTENIYFLLLL